MSKRRRKRSLADGLPKGTFRLPSGQIAQQIVYTDHRGRRISIIGIRRESPDLELLAKVLVEMARDKLAAAQEGRADQTKAA